MAFKTALSALALASIASAHGHISAVIVDGTQYIGTDPNAPDPNSVGWVAQNLDNGYVEPASYGSPDIVCHKQGRPATAYATVAAGGSVTLTWNTWPDTHHGPIMDYLASCNGDCTTVDSSALSFAKIAESGLLSGSNPGYWATDDLLANGFSRTITIPASVAPGKYVLRTEILALHSASSANGAQNYPQCINLDITGSGTTTPSGSPATSFYTADDPSVMFNLYQPFDSYDIPGPDVWVG